MNDLLELLPAPPERELPPVSFAKARDDLVRSVQADLRRDGRRRVRGLGGWLSMLCLAVLVLSAAGSGAVRAHSPRTEALVAAVAGAAPVAASAVMARMFLPARARLELEAGR